MLYFVNFSTLEIKTVKKTTAIVLIACLFTAFPVQAGGTDNYFPDKLSPRLTLESTGLRDYFPLESFDFKAFIAGFDRHTIPGKNGNPISAHSFTPSEEVKELVWLLHGCCYYNLPFYLTYTLKRSLRRTSEAYYSRWFSQHGPLYLLAKNKADIFVHEHFSSKRGETFRGNAEQKAINYWLPVYEYIRNHYPKTNRISILAESLAAPMLFEGILHLFDIDRTSGRLTDTRIKKIYLVNPVFLFLERFRRLAGINLRLLRLLTRGQEKLLFEQVFSPDYAQSLFHRWEEMKMFLKQEGREDLIPEILIYTCRIEQGALLVPESRTSSISHLINRYIGSPGTDSIADNSVIPADFAAFHDVYDVFHRTATVDPRLTLPLCSSLSPRHVWIGQSV